MARVEAAQALVFVFPVWWWSVPAVLKGWFDRVLRVNWACGCWPRQQIARRVLTTAAQRLCCASSFAMACGAFAARGTPGWTSCMTCTVTPCRSCGLDICKMRVSLAKIWHRSVDEVQASVARCLRTPPYAARRKGLDFGVRNCLRSDCYRSTIVICNCTVRADTVAPRRDKANPFRRSSILFRPHDPQMKDFGGAAGYRPRVRSAYYERVYVHSSCEHSKHR